jgi:enoyl-CoA hydratase/carnithine racemase
MALVERELHGDVVVIRLNRPEKLNALNAEMLTDLARLWTEFRDTPSQKVAILTGAGRGFCVGEDLVESAERGTPGLPPNIPHDPFWNDVRGPAGSIDKPIIAAVNGWAMGGGWILAAMADLRVAARSAVFEISEAKHWALGAYTFAFIDTLPWAIATEAALGFRFSAERAYQMGFVNRLASDDQLLAVALEMSDHLLSLPTASRRNTLEICRRLRPTIDPDVDARAAEMRSSPEAHAISVEARRAFAANEKPKYT